VSPAPIAKEGAEPAPGRPAGPGCLLILPFVLWNVFFVILPLLAVMLQSTYMQDAEYNIIPGPPTLDNFKRAFEGVYGTIVLRSAGYAGLTTLLCMLAGYPLAYFIAVYGGKRRSLFLILVMLPFWTSYLVRTYAWMTLLQTEGVLNGALLATGLVHEPLQLLNTPFSVVLGLTYSFLPFATLPIYVSLEHLDRRLVDAASDLGASPASSFRHVILPLSLPGVMAGSLLTFVPAMGDFVTVDLLGGPETQMVGNQIQQQFLNLFDWPFGSALSLLLMVLMLGSIILYHRLTGGELQ